MSEKKDENPMRADYLEACLGRLRKRLTYVQDEMDITAHAIKSIEADLAKIKQEDEVANEKTK